MNKQSGNVLEVVIIIVLVLAVVGLIVWRVVDHNNSQTASTTSQTNNSSQNNPVVDDTQPADANKGYVVLTDWGVRFKAIDGFSVKYYKAPSTAEYDLYEFTTPTIEALNNCSGKNESGRINAFAGGVSRTTEKYDLENMASAPTALYEGNKIGNYYYYYSHPQALCSLSDADLQTESSQTKTMQTFLLSLEPAR